MYGHFGPFFALLPPPYNPEHQNFEKKKKLLEILSRQNFLLFWAIFALLPPPLTIQKIKNFEKMKKTNKQTNKQKKKKRLEIFSFYICVP